MEAYENTPAAELPEFIRQFEARRLQALRRNDADAMTTLLAPGFTFVRETGEIVTRERYLDDLRTGMVVYGPDARFGYQHSYHEAHLFIVIGLVTGEISVGGAWSRRRLRSAATWYRHEVGWQALLVTMTEIAPDVPDEVELGTERVFRVQ